MSKFRTGVALAALMPVAAFGMVTAPAMAGEVTCLTLVKAVDTAVRSDVDEAVWEEFYASDPSSFPTPARRFELAKALAGLTGAALKQCSVELAR